MKNNFHGSQLEDNLGTTLGETLNSSDTVPFDKILAAGGAALLQNLTFPTWLVLDSAAATPTSAIEVIEVSSVDTGTNKMHVTGRGLNNTTAQTWATGSLVECRPTSLFQKETTDYLNAADPAIKTAKVSAFQSFS